MNLEITTGFFRQRLLRIEANILVKLRIGNMNTYEQDMCQEHIEHKLVWISGIFDK